MDTLKEFLFGAGICVGDALAVIAVPGWATFELFGFLSAGLWWLGGGWILIGLFVAGLGLFWAFLRGVARGGGRRYDVLRWLLGRLALPDIGSGVLAVVYPGWLGWVVGLAHSFVWRVCAFPFLFLFAGTVLFWPIWVLVVAGGVLSFVLLVLVALLWRVGSFLWRHVFCWVLPLVGLLAGFLNAVAIVLFDFGSADLSRKWRSWMEADGPLLDGLYMLANDRDGTLVESSVAFTDVTSCLSACKRLRRRARWVRALEAVVGGGGGRVSAWLRGRWVPDLPSHRHTPVQRYLLASVENGARILGGGSEKTVEGDGTEGTEMYFVLETAKSTEVVFPSLLGSLRQYALFRERTSDLLLGLRSRASEWCRARSLRPWVADLAVCSAVNLAMEPSTHEGESAPRVRRAIERLPLLPASC